MQENVIAFVSLILVEEYFCCGNPLSHLPLKPASVIYYVFLLKLEKIKFSLRGCPGKFNSRWEPLLDHVDKLPATETSPILLPHLAWSIDPP